MYVLLDSAYHGRVVKFVTFDSFRSTLVCVCVCVYLCFFDLAAQYIRINKTNLMHYLSLVYFVFQPLHVSGVPTLPGRCTIYPQYISFINLYMFRAFQPNQDSDALFILSIFRLPTSTCFGRSSPTKTVMHYLSLVYFVYQPLHVSGVPTQPGQQTVI